MEDRKGPLLPIGLRLNKTYPGFENLQFMLNSVAQQQSSLEVHVWRYYRWFTNMYNVSQWNQSEMVFDQGGFQGGRGDFSFLFKIYVVDFQNYL